MPDLFQSLGPSTFPWAVGGAIVAFLAMALIQAYYGRGWPRLLVNGVEQRREVRE